MTGFEAYQMFLAMKNHFTSKSYDFVKFKGKTKVSVASYEKRRDDYMFRKLGNLTDPQTRLLSCMLADITWINDITGPKGQEAENSFNKVNDTLTYTFKEELKTFPRSLTDMLKLSPSEQYPFLLLMYINGKVSIQTLVILDSILGFLNHWDKQLSTDPLWPEIYLKIAKYRPFLVFDKGKFHKIAADVLISKA